MCRWQRYQIPFTKRIETYFSTISWNLTATRFFLAARSLLNKTMNTSRSSSRRATEFIRHVSVVRYSQCQWYVSNLLIRVTALFLCHGYIVKMVSHRRQHRWKQCASIFLDFKYVLWVCISRGPCIYSPSMLSVLCWNNTWLPIHWSSFWFRYTFCTMFSHEYV